MSRPRLTIAQRQSLPKVLVEPDPVNSDISYIGIAIAGSLTSDPVWNISRNTQVGDSTQVEQTVQLSSPLVGVWDKRTTYVYG